MLDNVIEKKPDGIGLAACDTQSVEKSLQAALDAGIPVVCFDTGVDNAPEGSVYATVATDNAQAGGVAAENMFPVIEEKVKAATADKKVRIGEVNQDATVRYPAAWYRIHQQDDRTVYRSRKESCSSW